MALNKKKKRKRDIHQKQQYKKLISALFCILILVLLLSYFTSPDDKTVTIGNTIIKVEIADTPELHYKGLSFREQLCDNCGMLFVFPTKDEKLFAMRNMKFPLDMIWIDEDRIVKIDKNLTPEGKHPKKIYSSKWPVDLVLEVNGGFCDKHHIRVNDRIRVQG